LKHTQTYLTLSLSDIADSVKLVNKIEAEKAVLRMIEQGDIFASINQRDGMVSFHEDPEQYNSIEMMEKLDKSINKTVDLAKKLKGLDETVSLSVPFLQRTMVPHDKPRAPAGWSEMDDISDKILW